MIKTWRHSKQTNPIVWVLILVLLLAVMVAIPSCVGSKPLLAKDRPNTYQLESGETLRLINPPAFMFEEIYTFSLKDFGSGLRQKFLHLDFNADDVLAAEKKILTSIPNRLHELKSLEAIIEEYGFPPDVGIFQNDSISGHLNLYYGGIHLYFGTDFGELHEVRISEENVDYTYKGRVSGGEVRVGTLSEDFFSAMGEPKEIVEGKSIDWSGDEVFFKNREGKPGLHYIDYKSSKVRFFFSNDKVSAIYHY